MALTLGTVTFQGFEIPEKVNFGGKQSLITHKLPGGARVIDAMGRDDDDIAWGGRFRSNSAGPRARAVDAMKNAGRPVTLSWDAFRFQVVVSEFKADFERPYEIPYTITCHVVTAPSLSVPGLADLLGSDLARTLGLGGLPSLTNVADAVSGVQGAIAAAKALKAGFPSGLASIADSLSAARGIVGQAAGAADSLLSATSPDFATNLLNQASAMSQLDTLQTAAGTLGRMAATVQGSR